MTEKFNPYDVLGADYAATPEGLSRLYRDLAKRHHPDVGGDRAGWDQLTLAYEILSDPDRRAFYDQTGRIDAPNPETDRQQAHTIIASQIAAFSDLFVQSNFDPNRDPRRLPLMEIVEDAIRQELAEAGKALQTGRAHLNFMCDYTKRITRREGAEGVDQIAAIMQQKISMLEKGIIQVEEAMRVRQVALTALADYRFERDQQPQGAFFGVTA